ncbi:DUF349 domain-containing protein [Actinomyces capricornis]|uniref:ATPase n=1 Tax=Actinomyces capricornis TaxID=2755559 RepID=A0ABM7UEN8_9ACTO|nr:DUF349 domain-containing protein [Actinomyces capricornis]BDA65514.1 hypothetical protein MANAM107_23480 [Actinomyces capricornis]
MTEQNQPTSELNPTAASTAQAQDPAVDDAPSTSGASAPVTTPTAEPREQPAATTEAESGSEPESQAPESPSGQSQDDPAITAAAEPAQDGAPGAPEPTERPEPAQTPAATQPEDSEQQADQGAAEETASPEEGGPAPTPAPGEVPAPGAAAPSAPAAPAEPPVDPQEAMDAAKWGRVDGEGRVFVQDGGAEREVGQFPDAPVAEAMAFYVRRYLDLKATIDLFATRLPHLSVREIDSTLKSIEESLAQPAAVGDLEGLRARFAALRTVAAERRTAVAAERAAAKEQALKDRTAIVERAEAIAAQDPARTQWKNSGAELRELLETWKEAQRRGPRLDRSSEDGLWKRFSHARTTFDRHRRQFFSELDAKQSKVKAAKEALIKRAEELQHSTDWAGTSAKYRDLMAEWKKAGRASRKEDDALWARFRAAQQVFFDARRAKDEAVDAEFAENLKVKEALVAKAEALLPIKDIKAAKKALRPIQDAWEEAGRVPRSALRRIEGRMRAVEDAIREAENAEWRRTDPETKARAEGLAGQLEDAIASLEKELDAARASGDAKKVAEAEAALTARRAWLDQVRRSAKA